MTTERNAQGVDGLAEVMGLLGKATPGEWRFYESKLRPDISNVRVMEIQRGNGRAIIPWAGFDSPDMTKTAKRANAKAMVAAVNYLRSHGEAIRELVEKAELVADLASLEWQEADGSRKGATNNRGERLYFVSPDLIEELRAALAKFPEPRP